MLVEITDAFLQNGIASIVCTDCSEEHLQWVERYRADDTPRELLYLFDTKDPATASYLRTYLKRQKVTRTSKTYGEALRAIIGTITQSPKNQYRDLDV